MSSMEKDYWNIMEKLVEEAIDECFEKDPGLCRCPQCRGDIAAFALNQLKPIYVSTSEGEVYSRLQELDWQNRCNLLFAVHGAIKKVSSSPRHGDS